MDFEAWERGHEVITEFGYCSYRFDSKTGEPVPIGQGHWVVSENDHYRNGTFVPDNRDVSFSGSILSFLKPSCRTMHSERQRECR